MSKKVLLSLVILIGIVLSFQFNLMDRLRIAYTFTRVDFITGEGDMGWAGDVSVLIENLKLNVDDKELLMNKMLESKDGSIAAEGMVFAFELIEDYDELLATLAPYDFENDGRWNYFVYTNDKLYQDLVIAAKIRSGMNLTDQEIVTMSSLVITVFEVEYERPDIVIEDKTPYLEGIEATLFTSEELPEGYQLTDINVWVDDSEVNENGQLVPVSYYEVKYTYSSLDGEDKFYLIQDLDGDLDYPDENYPQEVIQVRDLDVRLISPHPSPSVATYWMTEVAWIENGHVNIAQFSDQITKEEAIAFIESLN